MQAHDAVADGRLAAAGLAHEPEHLAGADRERHVVDGVHDAPAAEHLRPGVEVLDEVLDLECRNVRGHLGPGWKQATR